MKKPTELRRAIAADHVDVMDVKRLPTTPPVECSADKAADKVRPSVLYLGDRAVVSPNPDARLRRWLRKYGSGLFEVFTDEDCSQVEEPRLFLMALTLIEHRKAVENHEEWVKDMEQREEALLHVYENALSIGAKRKELYDLRKDARQVRQDIENVKDAFREFSTQVNETTGYHHEEAKCYLSDRAASAASCCDASSPSNLNLIAKSIERATAFAAEGWNTDKEVLLAIEKVLSRNSAKQNNPRDESRDPPPKPPINEVYAEFKKCRRPAVQKAVRRLGFASFFKPDPRSKSGD